VLAWFAFKAICVMVLQFTDAAAGGTHVYNWKSEDPKGGHLVSIQNVE
jgi:hypothetical protein